MDGAVVWLCRQLTDVIGLADLGCVRVRPHFLWYHIPVNYLHMWYLYYPSIVKD